MSTRQLRYFLLSITVVFFTACGSSSSGDSTQQDAIDTIAAYAENGSPVPTVEDYANAGVVGVNAGNIDTINATVEGLTKEDVDTTEKIQDIVNELGVGLSPVAVIKVTRTDNTDESDMLFPEGQSIRFSADESTDPDGTIVSYLWTEGSKTLFTISTFDISTLSVGKHLITLTVTDNDGNSASSEVTVRIFEQEPETEPPVEQTCLEAAGYGTVTLANGQVWLDRNLGASQVATNESDTLAFGNLYQWGRGADGHESRNSPTTTGIHGGMGGNHATTLDPNLGNDWDGLFITEGSNSAFNLDWTKGNVDADGSQRAAFWATPASASNLNQVCPCGYVVPSVNDFTSLSSAEVIDLKLPLTGLRFNDGSIRDENFHGNYWTNDVSSNFSIGFFKTPNPGSFYGVDRYRAWGLAVRCIKPIL